MAAFHILNRSNAASCIPRFAEGKTSKNHKPCCSQKLSCISFTSPKRKRGVIPLAAAASESSEIEKESFCIIESPGTIVDLAKMQFEELQDNVKSRRNKIFLLMEEVRRLRIQQRLKGAELGISEDDETSDMPEYSSLFPFLPPLTYSTLKLYYATCFALCGGIIFFGGLLAPVLELKLGIGFTSYTDFIHRMHLPVQLSQVDPIVASFSGGAVGVISSLMVVEANNIIQQDTKRCRYCHGTGYLSCALCSATGTVKTMNPRELKKCPNCSGVTKVMCPTCLCTGMALASEHDRRIDPFD